MCNGVRPSAAPIEGANATVAPTRPLRATVQRLYDGPWAPSRSPLNPVARLQTIPIGEVPGVGAHIVTPRRGYLHHGIYTVGRHVIHYGGLLGAWRRGSVEEVPITEFSRGRPIFIVHGVPTAFDRLEVIRRARSRVGENLYQLLTNNCEHFCEWCLRGEHRSYQVEAWVDFPNGVMRAIGRLWAGYAHHDFQSVWQDQYD